MSIDNSQYPKMAGQFQYKNQSTSELFVCQLMLQVTPGSSRKYPTFPQHDS